MTVYPASRDHSSGSVIFLHGGAWRSGGSALPLYQDWAPLLKKRNLRAFSLEHRTTPRYRGKEPVLDVIEALRFIRQNADRFGVPPDRFVLIGFSSGGHLAVLAAQELASPRWITGDPDRESLRRSLKGVVAFYAPLDPLTLLLSADARLKRVIQDYLPPPEGYDGNASPLFRLFGGKERNNGELLTEEELLRIAQDFPPSWRDVSPMHRLDESIPPLLLVHGLKDGLVPPDQSFRFYQEARRKGIRQVQYLPVPEGDHNFVQSRSRWARIVEERSVEFATRLMSQ